MFSAAGFREMIRTCIFISATGLSWDNVFDAAFPAITAFFNGTGFEYYNNIIANRMDEHGGITKHPTVLKDSFEKGQTVVRVLEKGNVGEQTGVRHQV
ncbi:MAG: hypothetical protein STSR0009_22930 [Methanoregula sp.]